jgi:ubiquinone biosynthesis monooxygenase Coq7
MERAAEEENDHLEWCERRVSELGGHLSYLNPMWYAGSFAIGAAAGVAGDKWSLGFVVETENQVISHLSDHLKRVSEKDKKSRAILEQMRIDEARHGAVAKQAGGAELPPPVRRLMKLTSKVMTGTAYWV